MSVSTTATDPVDTLYDILNNAGATTGGYGVSYGYVYGGGTTWTNTAPEVYRRWETDQQDREHNNDPALYLWSPETSDRPALGAEYDDIDEFQFVDVSIWVLDDDDTAPSDVVDYANDVIGLVEEYGTDNKGRTEWNTIRPTGDNDLRAENVVRKTDHFVITVSVDLRRVASTGVV